MNGTIEFTTYEDKPVNPCADPSNVYYTAADQANCAGKLWFMFALIHIFTYIFIYIYV